jgi:hypothetical protein
MRSPFFLPCVSILLANRSKSLSHQMRMGTYLMLPFTKEINISRRLITPKRSKRGVPMAAPVSQPESSCFS